MQDVQFSSDVARKAGSASPPVIRRNRSVLSKTGRFERADRILCSRDFLRVVKSGERRTSGNFVITIMPRDKTTATDLKRKRKRLGVTVSKRIGNSVIRNRVKRCIREWFRHAREELPDGSDVVVIARQTARGLSGSEVTAVLDRMIPGGRARGCSRATTKF